tara:strand:+ start:70 stop:732 length:663 start_codon:yes stop_codon:yes gene_type:complete
MVDYLNYGKQTQQPTPGTKDELFQLFPIPVLVCSYSLDYTRELEWIRNLECGKGNAFNRQSTNTFVLDSPELAHIRSWIEVKVHEFVTNIYASTDKLVITQSWVNKSGKGESHPEHTHPNSIVSGVWYPMIHGELPPIKFIGTNSRDVALGKEQYNNFNSLTLSMPMKKGELVLFPSNLMHSVAPNKLNEERISLSFNTWAKGNIGDKKSLTYLPLDRCI